MCLASVMLFVGAKYAIAFTFCFIGKMPFPDMKCPKYTISLLKNSHLHISNLIPALWIFSKTSCIYFRCSSSVWLYINKMPQNIRKLSKYLDNSWNLRLRKTLDAVFTLKATLFHCNFPYGQVKVCLWSRMWMYWNMMVSWYNFKYSKVSHSL